MAFLFDILNDYSEQEQSVPVEEFIKQYLVSNGFDESEADEVVRVISETVETNSENHCSIEQYKEKGLSNAVWLRDTIDQATEKLDTKERDVPVYCREIKNVLRSLLGMF